MNRTARRLAWRVAVSISIICAAAALANRWVVALDRQLLHERLRQLYSDLRRKEDWSAVPPAFVGANYQWLRLPRPVLIAHALGKSGTPQANQISTAINSIAGGFRLLEVDLWLASDRSLRCFHGPGDPGPMRGDTCTLPRLLEATAPSGALLVLDIKNGFDQSVTVIEQLLEQHPEFAQHLIFQIYKPQHVQRIAQVARRWPLPGPIVTAYESSSAVDVVAAGAHQAGVLAVALPLDRVVALSRRSEAIAYFVHPVHSCNAQIEAAASPLVDGWFTNTGLSCAH